MNGGNFKVGNNKSIINKHSAVDNECTNLIVEYKTLNDEEWKLHVMKSNDNTILLM